MADVARVVFPPDANGAAAALARAYAQRGTITAMVVPKRAVPHVLTPGQARELSAEGAIRIAGDPHTDPLLLIATGAYQLQEVLRARARLAERNLAAAVIYLGEPGRYHVPRDADEAAYVHPDDRVRMLFPPARPRVFLTHTRPEPFVGALRRLDTGPATTFALGFINRGGTLDVPGLLFANRCTWAHVVDAAALVSKIARATLLGEAELAAIDGTGEPATLLQHEPRPAL
jgi:phosphoketolase